MNCPKCTGPMEVVKFDAVEVDRCSVCRGIWFDPGEVESLARSAGSEKVDNGSPFIGELKDGKQDIACPRCKVPMETTPTPGPREFHMERCPECKGIFLDAGEFTDIALDQSFWAELTKSAQN